MLTIRLSRHGRTKRPFYRIVLTEHTKSAQGGFKEVLGSYDPLEHKLITKLEEIKSWISKGAQMSERVAKLLFKETNEKVFSNFFIHRTRTAKTKKEKTA